MEVEFNCVECKEANHVETSELKAPLACKKCGHAYRPFNEFAENEKGIQYCGICGCRDLFIQKDFSRKAGCAIAAVGAVLAPFTRMISLLVCALVDLILYKTLPMITVCYRCHSIYREFAMNDSHEGFNLGINDRYRAAER